MSGKKNHDRRKESAIKALVKSLLSSYPPNECWYNMPVPYGYGTSMTDFVICFRGWFVLVETKRPKGGDLTGRQKSAMIDVDAANGIVVYIADEDDLIGFKKLLDRLPTLVRPVRRPLGLNIQNFDTGGNPAPALEGRTKMSDPDQGPQGHPRTDTVGQKTETVGGDTTQERAEYAKAQTESLDAERPRTKAQEVFGSTAVDDRSVDPDRPLYGEQAGEGGMGRAVSPMQGQEYYNQDEQTPTQRAAHFPGAPADPPSDMPQEEPQPQENQEYTEGQQEQNRE